MALERKISPLKRTAIAFSLGLTTLVTACGNDESKEPQKRDLLGEAADFYKETYEGMKRDTGRDSSYQEPENPAERFYGVYELKRRWAESEPGTREEQEEEWIKKYKKAREEGYFHQFVVDRNSLKYIIKYPDQTTKMRKMNSYHVDFVPQEDGSLHLILRDDMDPRTNFNARGVRRRDRIEIDQRSDGLYKFELRGKRNYGRIWIAEKIE